MNYSIKAKSSKGNQGSFVIKQSNIEFGISIVSDKALPNPAEIFLGSLAACILKSVERFSVFMKFEYSIAEIEVNAIREEKPPKLEAIHYKLKIYSQDKINISLLQKNIERFGTIFNTVKSSSQISGRISQERLER